MSKPALLSTPRWSETSFANPAVTIARGFSDTFAGIQPASVMAFVSVQLLAAFLATHFFEWLLDDSTVSDSISGDSER